MTYANPEDEKAYWRERVLSGRQAEACERYFAKNPPARVRAIKNWNSSARHHAHNLMRKYGMTLAQAEKIGVIPPDVQEALHGDRSA